MKFGLDSKFDRSDERRMKYQTPAVPGGFRGEYDTGGGSGGYDHKYRGKLLLGEKFGVGGGW